MERRIIQKEEYPTDKFIWLNAAIYFWISFLMEKETRRILAKEVVTRGKTFGVPGGMKDPLCK